MPPKFELKTNYNNNNTPLGRLTILNATSCDSVFNLEKSTFHEFKSKSYCYQEQSNFCYVQTESNVVQLVSS